MPRRLHGGDLASQSAGTLAAARYDGGGSIPESRYLVDDVNAGVDFYMTHLGFELKGRRGPAFAVVGRNNLTLWLSGPESSAARAIPDGRRPPAGGNRLVIEVSGLAEHVERLKKSGVRFRNDSVSGPGGRQIILDDPAGNPVELFPLAYCRRDDHHPEGFGR